MAEARKSYQHILLATDLGPDSEFVGVRAADIAERYQARLGLIHVVEFIPLDTPNDMILPPQFEIEESLVKHARERLKEFAAKLGREGAGQWVEIGSTKHEILRVAEEELVDLIILGSHGRTGLGRLLGSTANAVLHGASCDVLAVRVNV